VIKCHFCVNKFKHCVMVLQVGDNEASVTNADDRCEGLAATDERDTAVSDDKIGRNVSRAGDCQSSCDWSQPSADDTADAYHGVKFFREESSQGIDADDERGDSSSSSEADWQDVEGLCSTH